MESTDVMHKSNLPRLPVQADGTAKLYLLAGDTDKNGTTVDAFTDELAVPRAIAGLLRESEEETIAAYLDEGEDFWDWVENKRGFLDTFQTDEITYRVDSTLRVRRLEDLLIDAWQLLTLMTNVIPDGILINLARSVQDDGAHQILKEVERIRQHRKQHDRNPDPV